jgi:hypothetical protein
MSEDIGPYMTGLRRAHQSFTNEGGHDPIAILGCLGNQKLSKVCSALYVLLGLKFLSDEMPNM